MKYPSANPLFRTQEFGAIITIIILNGFYVNNDLITIFKPIRYSLLLAMGIYLLHSLVVSIQSNKIQKNVFFALYFHIFILMYGFILSAVNGGLLLIDLRKYLFLILSLILTMFVFIENNRLKTNMFTSSIDRSRLITSYLKSKSLLKLNFNYLLPIMLIIGPFLLLATDALIIKPIPKIVYDLNNTSLYSQNTTRLFAISGIIFVFLTLSVRNFSAQLALAATAIAMLAMAALGGARGDLLIGVIIIFGMLLRKLSFKLCLLLIIIFFFLLFFFQLYVSEIFNEFLIVKRLVAVLEGVSFGNRDILLKQSFNLLEDRGECLLIGCGFNYFQIYYGYEFGTYPHNIFAEILITYGIFFGGILIFLVILGVIYGFFNYYHTTFLYWVILYLLGLLFKSGSLIGIFSISASIFFAYLGLLAIRTTIVK